MLLVWFNPNLDKTYTTYTFFTTRRVGYKNSYNHEILQILCFYESDLISVNSREDIYHMRLNQRIEKNKKRFINRLKRFLDKY